MAPNTLGREYASAVFYDATKFVTPNGYFAKRNINPTMKDNPTMKPCRKCGVMTYAYKASKTSDYILYFHPGVCKKDWQPNGL
jgi:hypothetical protein